MVEKKSNFSAIVFFVIIGLLAGIAIGAQSFSSSRPHHPLQQITTTESGTVSVDANANGVIDIADNLNPLTKGVLWQEWKTWSGFCNTIFDSNIDNPAFVTTPAGNFLQVPKGNPGPGECHNRECILVTTQNGVIYDIVKYTQLSGVSMSLSQTWNWLTTSYPVSVSGSTSGKNGDNTNTAIIKLTATSTLEDDNSNLPETSPVYWVIRGKPNVPGVQTILYVCSGH